MRVNRRHGEYGGTIVESFFCILIICLILFGLLQIFQWSVAKMLCEYSSFYAVKGQSLGYNPGIVTRAARVALTGASGEDQSNVPVLPPYRQWDLSERAADYMMYSNNGIYGVDFEYWDPPSRTSTTPYVSVSYWDNDSGFSGARVSLENMPLMDSSFANFVFVESVDIPDATAAMYNHSQHYLAD